METDENKKQNKTNEYSGNVNLNGSVNGGYKNDIKTDLPLSKNDIILELIKCTHKTPPKIVASFLNTLFDSHGTKPGHWLFVAQHWTPRAINRVIAQMTKEFRRGDTTIKNLPAYFTFLIKYRKKRKMFIATIGADREKQL